MLDMVEMYSNRTNLSLNDELAAPAITFSRTFPGLFRLGKVASTRRVKAENKIPRSGQAGEPSCT